MSCSRVAEPHDCENVVTCAQHEQCFTDFYITPQGHVFYDLGCASNRVCDALNKFGKREVKRQDENLYICQECCNSNRCNRYGCGDQNKLNRTICYSCIDVEHPSKCDIAAVCDIDKECYTKHFINDMFSDRYEMGCQHKEMCKKMMGKESIIAGHPKAKKQVIGGFDNIDVCYYCCDNNFCNKKDCVNGHPSTQQTMQTSPITTTVTTTTTKRTNPPTTPATTTTTTQRTHPPTTITSTKVTHPPPTTKKVTHPPPTTTKVTHPPPTTTKVTHPPPTTTRVTHPPPKTTKVTHPPPTTKKVTHPPPTTKKVTHPPPTTTTIKRTHPPPTTTTTKRTHPPPTTTPTKRTHPPTTTTTTKRTTTPTPTKPAALNCYYCEYSSHEKECNHTTKCNLGEDQCYLSRVDGGADNDNLCFYKMGCMTKTDCHHYRSAIHNNGKAVMAMDTIEYFECCRHSNCNNHVVHKHPQRCNPLTTIRP
ncbi:mucin-2-like [Mytilus californianus]|uniref:mucin-2-like n=1 Tax=Mytilus californianus TaxID=6549 RepID=UPI00224562CE|nr:mucin-2-like [Mytilus californianus]